MLILFLIVILINIIIFILIFNFIYIILIMNQIQYQYFYPDMNIPCSIPRSISILQCLFTFTSRFHCDGHTDRTLGQ
ncbi:hypothetical protein EB796_009301 [Bugula neritina]|uniref:Uncharacterized protein n=1 Tax=Bugula neritina TaxID=10212 RepID=A0A7J7K2H6_BUGNE|nr:hypothetical protein EB796_009301 [Bugula neritina]